MPRDRTQSPALSERRARKGPAVLVVEDSEETLQRLAAVARQAFANAVVITTASIAESLDALTSHPIDIALVDLKLPDGSGIDLVQACSECSPLTRCVITAGDSNDEYLMPALAAGALGYLLNNQPETVLVQQLRLLADGVPPLAPPIAQRLMRYFAEMRKLAASANVVAPESQDRVIQLSERERQVLGLIATGLQIVDVAQMLNISANTVCTHIKSIYRKRNLSSRAQAALEARRLGLV